MARTNIVELFPGMLNKFLLILLIMGIQVWGCGGGSTPSAVQKPTPKTGEAQPKPSAEAKEEAAAPEMSDAERQREVLVQYNLGFPHYQAKDYELAIPHFWKVIELDVEGKYTGIYRQLGDIYVELEKADSALIVYEKGAEKDPKNIFIFQRLNWIYRNKGDLAAAIKACERILELDPGNEEYTKDIINLYVRNNEPEKAIAKYDELLAKDPNNKTYIDEKMNLIRMMGDSGALVEQYEQLHQQDPKNKEYVDILLAQYARQHDNEKILEMTDKLLALDPNNIDAMLKKADALNDMMKFQERIKVLQRVAELDPQNARALADIADCYINLKQFATARSYGFRALKISPNLGEAWLKIGEALEFAAEDVIDKRGGFSKITFDDKLVYQKACEAFRRAASIPETSARAQRKLEALESVIPSKEDKFMHPDQDQPRDPVYKWTL